MGRNPWYPARVPDPITQDELREFVRLTIELERGISAWAALRSAISTRILQGADVEEGEITLEMLVLEAAGKAN